MISTLTISLIFQMIIPMTNRKLYPALDYLKIILTILVIAIHFAPFGSPSAMDNLNFYTTQYFTRIAVPGFFVMSSFLIFSKCNYDNFDIHYVMAKCKHFLYLYLIWTAIYGFYIFKSWQHGRKTLLELIRDFFFVGSYLHLWYFPAIILALFLTGLLLKLRLKPWTITIIASIFYCLGLLGHTYFRLNEIFIGAEARDFVLNYLKIFYTTRNGLFEGFLFVAVGMLLAHKKDFFENISPVLTSILIGLFFIINILEVNLVKHFSLAYENDFYICTVPLVSLTIILCINNNLNLKINKSSFAKYCEPARKITAIVFYIHLIAGSLIKDIADFMKLPFITDNLMFPLTVVFSFLAAYIIYRFSNTKHMQFLKHIF